MGWQQTGRHMTHEQMVYTYCDVPNPYGRGVNGANTDGRERPRDGWPWLEAESIERRRVARIVYAAPGHLGEYLLGLD